MYAQRLPSWPVSGLWSINSVIYGEMFIYLWMKINGLIVNMIGSRIRCSTSPYLTRTSLPVSSHGAGVGRSRGPTDHTFNVPHPSSEMPALLPSQKPRVFPGFSLLSVSGGPPDLAKSHSLPSPKLSPPTPTLTPTMSMPPEMALPSK